ncbi:metallophosphoesterase [Promethearchaeum syntrophicum]|uniref:Metallophosphoesterase n=1 Tax=Promethearchaeum syntrophicum TaxID=2594042 RepID=A0A5B9D890_9ARCH|nr:metallophosphoesterase [Candidatus Prometheoarchaeum syntrophicum]QEE15273.1 Calcineurin-like phosphoesterase [Candidatus Prometheoarchaeum syntrophicum]
MQLNALHFSDLHFGQYNLKEEEKKRGDFDNFFSNLLLQLKKIIVSEKINLIIISGDFCSRNQFEEDILISSNKYLDEFINVFKEKDISVLICIGNHEISRSMDHSKRQKLYFELINHIKKDLNINFSKNFNRNIISYKIFKQQQKIFFSMDSTFSLTKEGEWENSSLNLKDIDEFLNEINSQINLTNYDKYIISHHGLLDMPNNQDIIEGLHARKIYYIFSGHKHDKYYIPFHIPGEKLPINNYIAGSILLSQKRRAESKSWIPADLQFNQYSFEKSYSKDIVNAWYWRYNSNARWVKEELKINREDNGTKCGIFSQMVPNYKESFDFLLDINQKFDENSQCITSWEDINKDILNFSQKIHNNNKLKKILFDGNTHLSIGFSFGYQFRQTTGYKISYKNQLTNQTWNLEELNFSEIGPDLEIDVDIGDEDNKYSVIIINIGSRDVVNPTKEYLLNKKIKFEKLLSFKYSPTLTTQIITPLINSIIDTISNEISNYKKYYLFIAGPLAFFGLLATKFNMITPLQLHEFSRTEKNYFPSMLLI